MSRTRYSFSEVDLTAESLENELTRIDRKARFKNKLRSTAFTLVVFAAVAVIISVTLFPVLRIFGSSMEATLQEGDIVIAQKTEKIEIGDLVAFYFGNKVLVKRCIAKSGDVVFINNDGEVFINEKQMTEPYVSVLSKGELDIDLPYRVPSDRIFVMGDDRENSIDSRNTQIGCVAEEQVIGKIRMRIWPMNRICIL